MPNAKLLQSLLDQSNLLCRSQFGRQPEAIELLTHERCLVFFFRGLTEKRDARLPADPDERYTHVYILLSQFIFPPLRPKIETLTGRQISLAFMDWTLESNTAMITVFLKTEQTRAEEDLYEGKAELHQRIASITESVQKESDTIESFRMEGGLLVIVRKALLISLEKKMLKKGFASQLRLTKRELEVDRFRKELPIGDLLHRTLKNVYLDWAFEDDISLLVLELEQQTTAGEKIGTT